MFRNIPFWFKIIIIFGHGATVLGWIILTIGDAAAIEFFISIGTGLYIIAITTFFLGSPFLMSKYEEVCNSLEITAARASYYEQAWEKKWQEPLCLTCYENYKEKHDGYYWQQPGYTQHQH
ncbi:MAG: hypothetical protein WC551_13355 [Patescibacteria group bacterium]